MKLNGRPRWTVISAAAAAITIGAAGTALAGSSGNDSSLPSAIRLQDSVPVATTSAAPQTESTISVIPSRVLGADDSFNTSGSADGQFGSADGTFDSPGDSPNTVSASPDDSAAGVENSATVDDTVDSPDVTAPAGAATADAAGVDDTVNSFDSPASVASVDATVDSPDVDSPDSSS